MTQIALIRTGATDYDEQGRIAGALDIPLCHNGAGQVTRLVDQLASLPLAAVYSAPDQASMQSAEAIASAKGSRAKRVDKFQNLDMGLWQGKLIADVRQTQKKVFKQWQEHPETICPPEGETLAEAIARISPALKKIIRKSDDAMVAIVAPQPLCNVLRALLKHVDVSDLWASDCDCGSWELIDTRVPA